ncbi:hypothetical protein Taro_015552 [Colocasia esculenta]|uniref:Uncharacterized protein n=1 Tax=Colocasia esculenta TaxID=4460 RepID=A0A843UI28_COLES|nr:hypothetical protein [Colocasia esculenta]
MSDMFINAEGSTMRLNLVCFELQPLAKQCKSHCSAGRNSVEALKGDLGEFAGFGVRSAWFRRKEVLRSVWNTGILSDLHFIHNRVPSTGCSGFVPV